jgi:ribosome-binding factor A
MGAEHGNGMRVRRVAEAVREELASLLVSDVKDPGAAGAIITRVDLTGDLRSARVHVRLLDGGSDAERRRAVVEALGRASGMLRREVAQRLRLRSAPELRFFFDDGLDGTMRIEQLLAEIEAERTRRSREG